LLNLSYRELLALTGGSRVGSHVLGGAHGDLVLSAHRGGDHVQGDHSVQFLPHVRLPRLVLLTERLTGRVSVKEWSRFGWFLVTLACGGVRFVQIVRVRGFSSGWRSRDSFIVLFEILRDKFREVLFRILSEAYLLANLEKQVPLRAVLVLVL
jgi:hypothetical protein